MPATASVPSSGAPSLKAFAADFFARHLPQRHVPGGAFVFAREGRVELLEGYGVDALETQRPVDPSRTVFRFGSVSKLVTAVAALQLVEQGRLPLHEDVNRVLKDFRVPATFPEPLTPFHLLTHTEGLEARMFGIFARSAGEVQPLSRFLAGNLPERFVAPGRIVTYGNFSSALLGALVEAVSGLPFEAYVEQHVFAPLGMASSTFRQTLPAPLAARLSGEYFYDKGTHQALRPSFPHMTPAGGMYGSLEDLGRLVADLTAPDGVLLKRETKALMFQTHFRAAEGLPGAALGLFEVLENGQRCLVRDGETEAFIARVVLLPERGEGFAFVINARDKKLCEVLTSEYLDAFHPAPAPPALQPVVRDAQLEGLYRFAQHTRHEFTRLVTLATGVAVSHAGDTLVIEPKGEEPFCGLDERTTFRQVRPGLYRGLEREVYVAFRKDEGRVLLCSGSGYHGTLERVGPLGQPLLHAALALLLLVGSLALAALAPRGEGTPAVRGLACLLGAVQLAFLVLLLPATMLIGMQPGVPAFVKGSTPLMRATFVLPTLALGLALGLVGVGVAGGGLPPVALGSLALAAAFQGFVRHWRLQGLGALARVGRR